MEQNFFIHSTKKDSRIHTFQLDSNHKLEEFQEPIIKIHYKLIELDALFTATDITCGFQKKTKKKFHALFVAKNQKYFDATEQHKVVFFLMPFSLSHEFFLFQK